MNFLEVMRDRRGFIHKRLIGAATGFFGGGGIPGAIGGFIGGGNGGKKVVPGRVPREDGLGGGFRRAIDAIITRRAQPLPTGVTRFTGPRVNVSTVAPSGGPCVFPFVRQADGTCKFDLDPGEGTGFPGGDGGGFPAGPAGPTSMVQPTTVCIETMVCPQFADGKKGVLWMSALSGQVFCLPRGVNGSGFGLIRKNRPRRKAFVTAAEIKRLQGQATTRNKAKKFAALTGQVCSVRTRAPRRARQSEH